MYMERKWTNTQYNVKDCADVTHKDVKIYSNINQFPALPFCAPHYKPCGARGLSKHYHFWFDIKLGNGVCVFVRIPCSCVANKSMQEKPWISDIKSNKQERYKSVTNCTYCSVLG